MLSAITVGGLGIRRMVPHYVSFLMKLAFNIVTKTESLWVRVLRSKYKVTEMCLKVIQRARCSYVWRSLSKLWKNFHERLIWSIGDGRFVSFAHDLWVSRLGALKDHLCHGKYVSPQVKVIELVDENECWKWEELAGLFKKEILEHLVASHPP